MSSKLIWCSLKRYCYRRCKKKIRTRVANRVKRVRLVCKYKNLDRSKWLEKRFFSDESKILIGNDCSVYIWRRSDESWLPDCISPGTSKKISVMIWGCMMYHGVGMLCRLLLTSWHKCSITIPPQQWSNQTAYGYS